MTDVKTQIKSNALEITMLKQAIVAQRIRAGLDEAPQGEWRGLMHNHLCEHCDESWRCDCDDGEYLVTQHGCDAQAAASQRLAIALSMPSKWDAPYLSRYAKPAKARRSPSGKGAVNAQIVANAAEIAKLKAILGISA